VPVALVAEVLPPAADRVDRELGGVVVDPDVHPPLIGTDVIHPIRDRLAQLLVLEVVHPHQLRLTLGSPFSPEVLEIADQLLLLGVHADHGLMAIDRALGDRVDVPELRVTVGMLRALPGLDVRLQAVPQAAQQLRHLREMNLMTQLAQPLGKMPDALGRPPQKRLRITPTVSVNQPLQIPQQRRIDFRDRLAPSTRPAHPPRLKPLPRPQLRHPLTNRQHRDPGRPRGRGNPTPARRPSLTRRPQPALTLVQLTRQRPELLADHSLINHTTMVLGPTPTLLQPYLSTALSGCADQPSEALPRRHSRNCLVSRAITCPTLQGACLNWRACCRQAIESSFQSFTGSAHCESNDSCPSAPPTGRSPVDMTRVYLFLLATPPGGHRLVPLGTVAVAARAAPAWRA